MPHFPQSQTKKRSPRVRVPNEEPARFDIGGHLVTAVLHRLSLTGGLAEFNGVLGAEVTIAEVRLNTANGPVSGLVEFLRPQNNKNPKVYPFRFLALGDADYRRLDATLKLMRTKGLGEG
ncbi:MAG TPA: hypothetical protein VIX19_17670 [Terriglobales bacterium]